MNIRTFNQKLGVWVMSGLLLIQPASLYAQEPEGLNLNFRDVELRQIIESVGELTGKNFLMDPRVRGKVTIIANDPVPEDALYDVMLSILAMNNFRAVEGPNDLIRIVPANVGPRLSTEKVPEDLITEIITIKHLNIGSVMPVIKPLLTAPGQTIAHKDTNKIIITDIRPNLQRIKAILARVDIASLSDFEIVNLKYVDAIEMQKIISKIHNQKLKHLIQIVADRESNRIIMSGPADVRLSVRALIAEMDTADAASNKTGAIKIIPLRYAKAEDLVKTIKNLFSSASFLENLGGEGIYAMERDDGDDKAAASDDDAGDGDADSDDDAEETEVIRPTRSGSSGRSARNYTIQADEETNTIIVGGPQKIIAAVQTVVAQLDIPRPQVLIEAIIADISAEQSVDIKSAIDGQKDGAPNVSGSGNVTIDSDTYRGLIGTLSEGQIDLTAQIVSGNYSLRFMIEALRSDSNTNILSTPSVLTMNNEEASIDVAEARYVRTGNTSGSGSTTTSAKKETFGTKLKVTPQITEGDAVRLDIEQETEDITGSSSIDGNQYPVSTKRVVRTNVLVNDGHILVLGGLITNDRNETRARVPWLSEIPWLGELFKDKLSENTSQTLMIFIRPTILRNPEEGYEFSKERYAQLRMEQLLYGEQIDSYLPDEIIQGQALLPVIRDDAEPGTKKRRVLRRVPVNKPVSG